MHGQEKYIYIKGGGGKKKKKRKVCNTRDKHLLLRTNVTWIDESLLSREMNSLMLAQQGFTVESAGTLTAHKWLLFFWNM
jgi:hypothetical protein